MAEAGAKRPIVGGGDATTQKNTTKKYEKTTENIL